MICPICGGRPAGAQVWVHCPRAQAAICMDHCYSGCRYHDTTASVGHCKYHACVLDKRKVLDHDYTVSSIKLQHIGRKEN